jgi:hypothetical protein
LGSAAWRKMCSPSASTRKRPHLVRVRLRVRLRARVRVRVRVS